MVFNSLDFFIFFPVVLILYIIFPKKYRAVWLLLASYFFYGYANVWSLPLILTTTAVSYFCGRLVGNTDINDKKRRKLYTALTALICLGLLAVFKYADFAGSGVFGVLGIFGVNAAVPVINLMLPVGISFYTFQTMSYVIDVYRGDIKAEDNFIYYALYVSFFPQLVAGPIERSSALLPQLKADYTFKSEDTVAGLKLMAIGFFKKVAVADSLAVYVNNVFNNEATDNPVSVWCAAVLFAFQIYGDFAGYTDIARGCARIMGIRLMDNFNEPYRAGSIKEFWGRWHISLSIWFRDYLYIPLGGNRVNAIRYLMNIAVVFIVSGLWHGAAWNFVIWGALHAIYQITGYLKRKPVSALYAKLGINENGKTVHTVRVAITFILTVFAWIAFRANNTADMARLYSAVFAGSYGVDSFIAAWEQSGFTVVSAAVAILVTIFMLILDRKTSGGNKLSSLGAVWWVSLLWCIASAWLILLGRGEASSFIYFQF